MNNELTYSNFVLESSGSNKNILIKPHVKEPLPLDHGVFYMGEPINKIRYEKGEKVGSLIFLKESSPYIQPSGQIKRKALFKCKSCNNETEFEAIISNVRKGNTTSCGCVGKEKWMKSRTTHGLSKHPLYKKWGSMINRCENEKDVRNYSWYGDRGVSVCDEWRNDFKAFYDHVMALDNAMKPGYTLDREKGYLGYRIGNLRWADNHTQSANRGLPNSNTSGYIGISKLRQYWVAKITVRANVINLGKFKDKKDAVDARNNFIIKNNITEYKIQEYV